MPICKQCGQSFQSRDAKLFCNRACYRAYRAAHPEEYGKSERLYRCEYCGKPVKRKPSELQRRVFCSRDCSNKAQSEHLASHPELRQTNGVPVVCHNCGKTFHVKPHRAAKAKYCSRECFAAFQYGKPHAYGPATARGSANPNFRGTSNHVTARLNALTYLGSACMICGWDVSVDVHHIVLRARGGSNNLENLVVLCPNHHRMVHLGLISQSELTRLALAAVARLSDRLPRFDPPQPAEHDSVQPVLLSSEPEGTS